MGHLTKQQMIKMGFASVGINVLLSDKASYHNCKNIQVGNHVRVDDFCVISAGSGGVVIGNYVHIAVYSSIIGTEKITLGDFANISSRVSIYSSSDDYSGLAMTNPMVPSEFTNVQHASVMIGRHVIIGVGSIILPGVTLAEGAAIGALSLVKNDCRAFVIYAGIPAIPIRERQRNLLELEDQLAKTECN
jgi:dTDP-4-amino-4,6-dideoxy-D-glucose acyltransferase